MDLIKKLNNRLDIIKDHLAFIIVLFVVFFFLLINALTIELTHNKD